MISRFATIAWSVGLVLLAALLAAGAPSRARAANDDVLELPPLRIGPGSFKMKAVTDPNTGKIAEATVAWAANEVKQLQRGDRLLFIDGRPVAGMTLLKFEEYGRGQHALGERIMLVFKGTRGWLRKREVTLELELVAAPEPTPDATEPNE